MVKVGDKIKIIYMDGEPQYTDKEGTVTHVDDAGQIHGTWGGCAVVPNVDKYTKVKESTYNGYKNRETWVVNLYLQGTEEWYKYYKSLSTLLDEKALAETIKLDFKGLIPDKMTLLHFELLNDALDAVDWKKIAVNFYD